MKNFFNSHKKACIITAAAVLALLLLTAIIIGVTIGKKPDGKTGDNGSSTSQSSDLTIEEPTDETNTSSELLPDSDNYISPDESEADKVLSGESKTSDSSTVSTPANTSSTNKTPATNTNSTPSGSGSTAQNSGNTGSTAENTSSAGSTSSQATVVQMADPDTGISWDGKSPIIYTYTDGTTGTEMKLGATYEQFPGMTTTITEMDMPDWEPEEYDPNCRHCGKLMGDGTNGTCVRWMMGDIDCPACGAHVSANTCHTCGQ